MNVKKIVIDKANRLYLLPPLLSSFILPEKPGRLIKRRELIDLASFNWPLSYSSDQLPDENGMKPVSVELLTTFKEEIANWLSQRFQNGQISSKEIFIGGRISQLILQTAMAYIDSGDIAFVPNPGIPLYRSVVCACNGEPIGYNLTAKNNWKPQFDRLSSRLGKVARLLFLNSPHNPTGTELSEKDMMELILLASRENILIINDAAYAGLSERPPVSLLSIRGGKRVGIEISSFSYLLGLPYIPFGFAVGNRDTISGLEKTSQLLPGYIPTYYIELVRQAIRQSPTASLKLLRNHLSESSAEASRLLNQLKLERSGSDTTPFVWARIEKRGSDRTIARQLAKRFRILAIPGSMFGENGEGFLRFSLTGGAEPFDLATKRLRRKLSHLTKKVKE